ncbi:MAG: ribosome rescue GTPase HflX [Thiotrichaceae bacterium]
MELFERPKHGETAILVQIGLNATLDKYDRHEFQELVRSAGADDVAFITGSRHSPDPKYFIGTGKADEVLQSVNVNDADVVIFDHSLTPAQERNLEKLFECRVMDRTGLILDIFAQRAQSHDGKLQVELAQLKHMSTRLIRGWTHLERQKGGIGMRGPGETQLETDRRLLNVRIKQINKRLQKVRNQRDQGRQLRQKVETPTVSLVGYTNAGKSTLFNKLTNAEVYVADQLFATLDPTLRRLDLPNQQSIVLADTVGFIKNLPHDLVAAFRSTLQETIEADILLHVIDSQDDQRDMFRAEVNDVIEQIGADKITQIEIMNKIDLGDDPQPRIEPAHDGFPARIWLSAQSGEGLDLLKEHLSEIFAEQLFEGTLTLPPQYARLRAQFYELDAVINENITDNGSYKLDIVIQKRLLEPMLLEENLSIEELQQ